MPCNEVTLNSDTEDEIIMHATVKDTCSWFALSGCAGFAWTSVVPSLMLPLVTVMNLVVKLLRTVGGTVRNHCVFVFRLLLVFTWFGTAISVNVTRNLIINPICSSSVCSVQTGTEDLLMIDSGAGVCVCVGGLRT